jgi:hypothetical protein
MPRFAPVISTDLFAMFKPRCWGAIWLSRAMDEISFHPYYAPPPAKDTSGDESPVSTRKRTRRWSSGDARTRGARNGSRDRAGPDVYSAQPLTDALSATLSQQQFRTLLVGAFSALALTLATIGLYGLMTCSVSLPTREFGTG